MNKVKSFISNMNAKQKRAAIIIALLILLVVIVGISFSVFTYTKTGDKENTVGTGSINMSYSEGSNAISITNAMPMTEKQAKGMTNGADGNNYYFDFTVTAEINGDALINYDVTAAKNPKVMNSEAEEAGTLVPDKDIRLRLEESTDGGSTYTKDVKTGTKWTETTKANTKTGTPEGVMVLYSGQFGTGSKDGEKYQKTDGTEMKRRFRMRMWVDKDYKLDDVSRSFSVIVNVYGKTDNGE